MSCGVFFEKKGKDGLFQELLNKVIILESTWELYS